MGDMGEYNRDYDEFKKQRKLHYQKNFMQADIERVVTASKCYKEYAGGQHLKLTFITQYGETRVDYWPSTGKWRAEIGKATGYGARSMLNYFKPKIFKE